MYTINRTSRSKALVVQEAKDIFRKRAATEEKLPKAKSRRPSTYILQETTTIPRDIDVNKTVDKEVPCSDLRTSFYPATRDLNEDEELKRRLPKSTALLLKT